FAPAAGACYASQPAPDEALAQVDHELKAPVVRRGASCEGLSPEGERIPARASLVHAKRVPPCLDLGARRTSHTGDLSLGGIPPAAPSAALL
ncbi:LysR family transcriptional regulator, partial [Tsukamurella paurometabola]|nr:LysR family transcriptional regulator [Tsukamurella paurometabola]